MYDCSVSGTLSDNFCIDKIAHAQDGSCNGLQHYAALGRDQAGAESVNLHPFDVPQDVYSDVVQLVSSKVAVSQLVMQSR